MAIYTISTGTANGRVNDLDLFNEITAGGPYSANLQRVLTDRDADTVNAVFDGALTGPEESTVEAIVLAHEGNPILTLVATLAVIPEQLIALPVGFGRLGSVIFDPSHYVPDVSSIMLRARGTAVTTMAGAQLRVVEEDPELNDDVVVASVVLPATAGAEANGFFDSTVTLRSGIREYRLEGDLGAAVAASVRSGVFELFRVTEVG